LRPYSWNNWNNAAASTQRNTTQKQHEEGKYGFHPSLRVNNKKKVSPLSSSSIRFFLLFFVVVVVVVVFSLKNNGSSTEIDEFS
jgi:hypothetical protein